MIKNIDNDFDLITVINNVPITTSLKVAEKFEKKHKNIIKNINNLLKNLGRLNFEPSSFYVKQKNYINSQNKKQLLYEFDKDFFVLLVMGFTGEKALKFKIDYINAFNRMGRFIYDKNLNYKEIKEEEEEEDLAEQILYTVFKTQENRKLPKNAHIIYDSRPIVTITDKYEKKHVFDFNKMEKNNEN